MPCTPGAGCRWQEYDGAHYVFKTTPSVTQVLEDQVAHVRPSEVEAAIETELQDRLAGRSGALLWPRGSANVPHREPRFLLAYLPLDFAISWRWSCPRACSAPSRPKRSWS
jgi:hypothetical protein